MGDLSGGNEKIAGPVANATGGDPFSGTDGRGVPCVYGNGDTGGFTQNQSPSDGEGMDEGRAGGGYTGAQWCHEDLSDTTVIDMGGTRHERYVQQMAYDAVDVHMPEMVGKKKAGGRKYSADPAEPDADGRPKPKMRRKG